MNRGGTVNKEIILYSTGCIRCKTLKKRLDESGITYREVNDVEQMLALGFTQVPVLVADGEQMDYYKAVKWIDTMEGTYEKQ